MCENEGLHNRVRSLEDELNVTNEMLDQARGLVEVLQEMLEENEAEQGQGLAPVDELEEEEEEESLDHTPPSSTEKKDPVDDAQDD